MLVLHQVIIRKAVTYCWVEQPTTDAEEDPDIDGKTETESKSDIQKHSDGDPFVSVSGSDHISDLGPGESEEEKQEGANELSKQGYNFVPDLRRQPVGEWEGPWWRILRGMGFGEGKDNILVGWPNGVHIAKVNRGC